MFVKFFFFCATECALLLLAHNAPVKVKNAQGWSPLAEAISYGDRQMSKDMGYFISFFCTRDRKAIILYYRFCIIEQ